MNKLILPVCLLGLFGLLMGPMAWAADTDVVDATVMIQNISVSVSDGDVSYGTMAVSTFKSTIATDLNEMQTATNDGNVTEDLNIKGQDTAAWTLESAVDANKYVHQFCNDTDADCSAPPTGFTAMTESGYTTLDEDVVALGTVDFQLRLGTPSSSISYTEQEVDVTVQAALAT